MLFGPHTFRKGNRMETRGQVRRGGGKPALRGVAQQGREHRWSSLLRKGEKVLPGRRGSRSQGFHLLETESWR